jgi:hypothetical protein
MREEIGQVLQVHKVGERGSEESTDQERIFRKHECKLVTEGVVMKTKTIYICEICGEEYDSIQKAISCEQIPTSAPIFKFGDMVRVLTGEGRGELVEVKDYIYIRPNYGGERFAHKTMYSVMFMNGDVRTLIGGIDCEAI